MKIFRYLVCERKKKSRLAAGAIVLLALMFASAAFGDVVDDSLPPDAPRAVKASARQAIQSGLDQDSVVRLTRAMLQNKFDAQQIQLAHALMIEAQKSGMPVQPMMNKAFEGMAKGVDPSLIVEAIKRVHSRNSEAYRNAAQLSGNKSRAANLGHELSAAMAAGFLRPDAERIIQMIRQRAQSMPSDQAYSLALECFKTARDVSRLGVSSQATTNMLAGALGKGFTHQEIHAMRSSFMAQAQQSQPQDLARRYSATIQEGKGFQEGPGGDAGGSSSGGNSGRGSVGPGGGGQSGGSGADSGGAGGSGPGGGKQ